MRLGFESLERREVLSGSTLIAKPLDIDIPVEIQDIHFADFDGDGQFDILVGTDEAETGTNRVLVAERSGGAFSEPLEIAIAVRNGVSQYAVGDIDNDGDTDIAATWRHSTYLLINDGAGSFSFDSTESGRVPMEAVAVLDVDLDGDNEVVGRQNTSSVYFEGGEVISLHEFGVSGTYRVSVADTDSDGAPNVLIHSHGPSAMQIISAEMGRAGNFLVREFVKLDVRVRELVLADFNQDGRHGFMYTWHDAVEGRPRLSVVDREGTEFSAPYLPVNDAYDPEFRLPAQSLQAGDFDGDGLIDIAYFRVAPGSPREVVVEWVSDIAGAAVVEEIFRTELFGRNILKYGDTNGDGTSELLYSHTREDGTTAVEVFEQKSPEAASYNFEDFLVLSASFGSFVEPGTNGDLNRDGTVSFEDFLLLSNAFGV